ncbi:MAG: PQQ-dependent sugar dehydrogenase [Vicinamibacterales bacterium]
MKSSMLLFAAVFACGMLPAAAQPVANSTPPAPAALAVPTGFGVSVFASGLTGARLMAVSPDGVLVVAQRANVVALPDANGDGQAEPKVLLSDLTYAHSVAFANGYLYIATTPAILRVRWANGTTVGAPETIAELPSSKPSLHSSRSLRVGPDGRLYVAMGSSCNFCVEPDPRRTTMQVFNADGSNGHAFATGLRNAVGFDWDPQTGRLWAGDNGIDKGGDEMPPDEINLVEEGKNYGHPFVIGRGIASPLADDRSAADRERAKAVDPVFELPPHMAPMGVAFYTGTRFPAAFRTSLYVALHGSTDRTTKVGYKVVRLIMEDGRPVRSEDFITGWLTGETVTGRPVGIVTGADGALYVSDDNKGFVYRVVALSP